MECISFDEKGIYISCDVRNHSVKGEWIVKGDILRLHAEKIKDLNGRDVDRGHDSTWEIVNTGEWMFWRGTSQFSHEHLTVTLKRNNKQE